LAGGAVDSDDGSQEKEEEDHPRLTEGGVSNSLRDTYENYRSGAKGNSVNRGTQDARMECLRHSWKEGKEEGENEMSEVFVGPLAKWARLWVG